MVTVERYSTLVASIYRAAVEPARWPEALEQIARAAGASGCVLLHSDHRGNCVAVQSVGVDATVMHAYDAYYERLDPVPAALDRLPVGAVVPRETVVGPAELFHTEFFNDWVRPGGYTDSLFAVLGREHGATSWLGAGGVKPGTDWSESTALLTALTPHLRQTLETQSRIAGLEQRNRGFVAAMDNAPDGLLIVGPAGTVVHCNPAAQRMLDAGDGFMLQQQELRAAIRRAVHHEAPAGDCLQIRRPSGARPYIVRVIPLTRASGGPQHSALLVVADPESEPEPAPDALRRIYGLTRAEAAVALRVLNGTGLKPIAEELSMSLSTVRTHLQHVFDKTDTHRQAELVRLLLGGLSATRSPESQPFG